MIEALERASASQKEMLVDWLSREEFNSQEKVKSITSLFDTLEIKKRTEERIREYYKKSLANLEQLNRPEERKVELYNFASFLMNRNH